MNPMKPKKDSIERVIKKAREQNRNLPKKEGRHYVIKWSQAVKAVPSMEVCATFIGSKRVMAFGPCHWSAEQIEPGRVKASRVAALEFHRAGLLQKNEQLKAELEEVRMRLRALLEHAGELLRPTADDLPEEPSV